MVKSLDVEISRGSRLTVHLAMDGTWINEPAQKLTWQGRTESVQFVVTVSGAVPAGPWFGRLTLATETVLIGHITFKVAVGATSPLHPTAGYEPVGESVRRYALAFISYASQDLPEVLKRVQVLALAGIRYFQDLLSLEPGDRWEAKLYNYIDQCDLFLLFWSRWAKQSEWVRKEVRYALQRNHGDTDAPPEIRPVILQGPPIHDPPEELRHLHFKDHLIYFIQRGSGSTFGKSSDPL
jgi:hypothetical protein